MPITEKQLKRLYQDEKMSMMEIAKKLNRSYTRIRQLMVKYQIQRRTLRLAGRISRDKRTNYGEIPDRKRRC